MLYWGARFAFLFRQSCTTMPPRGIYFIYYVGGRPRKSRASTFAGCRGENRHLLMAAQVMFRAARRWERRATRSAAQNAWEPFIGNADLNGRFWRRHDACRIAVCEKHDRQT
jgi:hypothetical protein